MISEHELAKGFGALWNQFFPLLTSNFMRVFNEVYVEKVRDDIGVLNRIAVSDENTHPDLVAEYAFHLARFASNKSISVAEAVSSDSLHQEVTLATMKIVEQYEGQQPSETPRLSEEEITEGLALAKNYERFIKHHGEKPNIQFLPRIAGSGAIDDCCADLSIKTTLYEVKTVRRNYQSKDLKQLIIYLGLQAMTGERRWLLGGLFNPREATYCTFNVDGLVGRLAGGRPPFEAFSELLNALSSDVDFDTEF